MPEIVEVTAKRQKIEAIVLEHLEKMGKGAGELTIDECKDLFKKIVHMSTFADFAPDFIESVNPDIKKAVYSMSVKLKGKYNLRAAPGDLKEEEIEQKQRRIDEYQSDDSQDSQEANGMSQTAPEVKIDTPVIFPKQIQRQRFEESVREFMYNGDNQRDLIRENFRNSACPGIGDQRGDDSEEPDYLGERKRSQREMRQPMNRGFVRQIGNEPPSRPLSYQKPSERTEMYGATPNEYGMTPGDQRQQNAPMFNDFIRFGDVEMIPDGRERQKILLMPGEAYNPYNPVQLQNLQRRAARQRRTGRVLTFKNSRMPAEEYPGEMGNYRRIGARAFDKNKRNELSFEAFVEELEMFLSGAGERVHITKLCELVDGDTKNYIMRLDPKIRFNYEVLVDTLMTRFQSTSTAQEVMEKLRDCKQHENEDILSFITRYSFLQEKLQELVDGYPKPRGAAMKIDVMSRIRPALATFMKAERPNMQFDDSISFDNMISWAQMAERAVPPKREAKYNDGKANKQSNNSRKPCTGCNSKNHSDDKCWKLHPELMPPEVAERVKERKAQEKSAQSNDQKPKQGQNQRQPKQQQQQQAQRQQAQAPQGQPRQPQYQYQQQQYQYQYQQPPRQYGRGPRQGPRPNTGPRACYKCGSPDHVIRTCPMAATETAQPQAPQMNGPNGGFQTFSNNYNSQQPQAPTQANYLNSNNQMAPQQWQTPTNMTYLTPELINAALNEAPRLSMFTASNVQYENWYDRPLAPSVLRRINPAQGEKEYFHISKVGTDVVEFSIKNENNDRGKNPPWKDFDLRPWSAVTNDKKMKILRMLYEQALQSNPVSREEIEKTKNLRREVTDRHMAVMPTRVGDIIVKDALMDTGATLTAITLKLLWALMGRCPKIKKGLERAYWLDDSDRSGDIIAAGGERVRVYGYINLPMSIGDSDTIDVPAAVYEDESCALILGTPALRKLGFALTAGAAMGIDLIEPPANYESEFAKLRDVMVEKVHRELGDKKYIGAEVVNEKDAPAEDQIENTFRNSSILVARDSGQTVGFTYGKTNKYGLADGFYTSDDESDTEENETDAAKYKTAFDQTVSHSNQQMLSDLSNPDASFPSRKTSTPKSPGKPLPTPEMSAIEQAKKLAKTSDETPNRLEQADNLRKRAITNQQRKFDEKLAEQGQSDNFQRLFEAIQKQAAKADEDRNAIQSKLTQMSEANQALAQRMEVIEGHFHLADAEDSSLRSATSGGQKTDQSANDLTDQSNLAKQSDHSNPTSQADQSMATQRSESIETGQEGLSLINNTSDMSLTEAGIHPNQTGQQNPTAGTLSNAHGAPEISTDQAMETSQQTHSQ